jgi:hypothetical protein
LGPLTTTTYGRSEAGERGGFPRNGQETNVGHEKLLIHQKRTDDIPEISYGTKLLALKFCFAKGTVQYSILRRTVHVKRIIVYSCFM